MEAALNLVIRFKETDSLQREFSQTTCNRGLWILPRLLGLWYGRVYLWYGWSVGSGLLLWCKRCILIGCVLYQKVQTGSGSLKQWKWPWSYPNLQSNKFNIYSLLRIKGTSLFYPCCGYAVPNWVSLFASNTDYLPGESFAFKPCVVPLPWKLFQNSKRKLNSGELRITVCFESHEVSPRL